MLKKKRKKIYKRKKKRNGRVADKAIRTAAHFLHFPVCVLEIIENVNETLQMLRKESNEKNIMASTCNNNGK